jgi:hypothetical protein
MGYVDGSTPAPPKHIPSSTVEGAEFVNNPAYDHWHDQDQLLLSGLLSSMTKDALCDVTAKSARDAWVILNHMFASTSHARVV